MIPFDEIISKRKYERQRLFLVVLPQNRLKEKEIEIFAQKNGVDYLNYRNEITKDIVPGQLLGTIEFDRELYRIKKISQNNFSKVILLYNFDLVLSYFGYDERRLFWKRLYSHLPNLEAIIGLIIPINSELLPDNFEDWKKEYRVFELILGGNKI